MQITYKATTMQEDKKFYPAIEFNCNTVMQQLQIINEPQQTRSKALTIARNRVKTLVNQ